MDTTGTFKPMNLRNGIMTYIKGALIGVANIIPGVSGGTFALILGVLERILAALHTINPDSIRELIMAFLAVGRTGSRQRIAGIVRKMDLVFLICLGIGAMTTILSLSFVIDYLLVNHPALTLSFFLGLLLPSIAVPWKMMSGRKTGLQLLMLIPGIALTVGVSLAFGRIGNFGDNFLWSFAAGVISISAMILPGISGSFVLLVMGQYQNVLNKLQAIQTSLDFHAWLWLMVFGLGCLVGLLVFSRFLQMLLQKKRNATLAFLIGLVIGSFWVLWPFKQYEIEMDLSSIPVEYQQRVAEKQDIRVATAPNILPDSTSQVIWNVLVMVIGLVCATGMNRFGNEDISEDPNALPGSGQHG